MSNTYNINEFNEVVTTTNGRVSNDSRVRRDATDLELQQQDEIKDLKAAIILAAKSFDEISWGYDGDYGSKDIMDKLEEAI